MTDPRTPSPQPATVEAPAPHAASPHTPGAALPPAQGTDGFSIAALVTGVVGLGVVPIVLGVVGLNRTRKTGRAGKGLAIAGIALGAVAVLVWGLLIGVAVRTLSDVQDGQAYGDNAVLDVLWDGCAGGDDGSCEDLFAKSLPGTEYQEFGATCGGRSESMTCAG
ncbi:DUF4190 domain-containing protein [Xylanimonas oleitrophica]|uniref:DUF4190 domain-containing protein n=1 Tax=Xylanimonas oleitrophica TaxID=2607479 RepID=UPI0015D005E4|nr:DUF4190 domain-containing protein [Xylanimonas oleitrophica]